MSNDPIMASVDMFAGNFAPRSWAACEGQLLAISSNSALFSLLGTIYGGDGRTTFGLPDLRGRVPMGEGSGPGLTPRTLGERVGYESENLTIANLPSHTHSFLLYDGQGDSNNGAGASLAKKPVDATASGSSKLETFKVEAPTTAAHAGSIGNTGANSAFSIMQPSLVLTFCICTQGTYPSRT